MFCGVKDVRTGMRERGGEERGMGRFGGCRAPPCCTSILLLSNTPHTTYCAWERVSDDQEFTSASITIHLLLSLQRVHCRASFARFARTHNKRKEKSPRIPHPRLFHVARLGLFAHLAAAASLPYPREPLCISLDVTCPRSPPRPLPLPRAGRCGRIGLPPRRVA